VARKLPDCDGAGSAGIVLDDQWLFQASAELVREDPGEYVAATARCGRDDQADRLVWITGFTLRLRAEGQGGYSE
jgi:hypothetical protein